MNNICCPFCKNNITLVKYCFYLHECKNHHVAVNFVIDKNIIENIILYNSEYRIDLRNESNNCLTIRTLKSKLNKYIYLPYDKNLTPENFNQKPT